VEITGAMIDFLPVEEDNGALIRCISDPSIRIVSLTVTEGRIFRECRLPAASTWRIPISAMMSPIPAHRARSLEPSWRPWYQTGIG
jgi:hypothetical protein